METNKYLNTIAMMDININVQNPWMIPKKIPFWVNDGQ